MIFFVGDRLLLLTVAVSKGDTHEFNALVKWCENEFKMHVNVSKMKKHCSEKGIDIIKGVMFWRFTRYNLVSCHRKLLFLFVCCEMVAMLFSSLFWFVFVTKTLMLVRIPCLF